jgi:hypothetical protein
LIKSTLTENKEKIWHNIQKEFKLNLVALEDKQKINNMQEIKFNAICNINSLDLENRFNLV